MKFKKRILNSDLEKCYAIGMFDDGKEKSFLIGTEKEGPILRYALDGTLLEEVTPGPGGVMTIAQVPGSTNAFFATEKFYSPNCGGDEAKIVCYTKADSGWTRKVVADLPYIHRFGFVKGKDGTWYLIATTIKSSCEYKEDWRDPGKVYVARLTDNLPLKLEILMDDELKNHGLWTCPEGSECLIATDSGVYKIVPPESPTGDWKHERIIEEPTSDITVVDFKNDGKPEILCLSPFHGDTISIYQQAVDGYRKDYECQEKYPFLHAICSAKLCKKNVAILGNRREGQELFVLYFDGTYKIEVIDKHVGPANCWAYDYEGNFYIIACNREINELALYEVIDCTN